MATNASRSIRDLEAHIDIRLHHVEGELEAIVTRRK
jgi:hypothetical protein